jgi:hypothetical protein
MVTVKCQKCISERQRFPAKTFKSCDSTYLASRETFETKISHPTLYRTGAIDYERAVCGALNVER